MLATTIPADTSGPSLFDLTRGQIVFSIVLVVVALCMLRIGWMVRDWRCGCRAEQAEAQNKIRATLAEARELEQKRVEREKRQQEARRLLDREDVQVIPRGEPVLGRHRERLQTETRPVRVRRKGDR